MQTKMLKLDIGQYRPFNCKSVQMLWQQSCHLFRFYLSTALTATFFSICMDPGNNKNNNMLKYFNIYNWRNFGLKLVKYKSKKDNKDQESIHSSTTPVPRYQMGK